MRRLIALLFGGRLQIVLIASFALVAALTVGLNTLVISRVINDYLAAVRADRVERDMKLADAFYQLKLDEIAAISHRLVLDPWVVAICQVLPRAAPRPSGSLTKRLPTRSRYWPWVARTSSPCSIPKATFWPDGFCRRRAVHLPLRRRAIGNSCRLLRRCCRPAQTRPALNHSSRVPGAGGIRATGTHLIDRYLQGCSRTFRSPRGHGRLAVTGISPLRSEDGRVIGVVLSAYLFNNDFTLVDRIKEVAGIDTVTIFLGDLRVRPT